MRNRLLRTTAATFTFLGALGLAITGCSSPDNDAEAETAVSEPQTTSSRVRPTTATTSPEQRLETAVSSLDAKGIAHQGRNWAADRAAEVCADWNVIGPEQGFNYASLGQTMNFSPMTTAHPKR